MQIFKSDMFMNDVNQRTVIGMEKAMNWKRNWWDSALKPK